MAQPSWWYRSSPWIGLVGGLLVASTYQLGLQDATPWFDRAVMRPLFAVSPVVAYVVLAAVGFGLGWIERWIEDRYIYTD